MSKVSIEGVDHSTFSTRDKREIIRLATRMVRHCPGVVSVEVSTVQIKHMQRNPLCLDYKITFDLGRVFGLPDNLPFVRTVRFTSSEEWSIIPDRFRGKKMPRVRTDQIKMIDQVKGLLKSWGVQRDLLSWYFADIGYYCFSSGGISLCGWERRLEQRKKIKAA